MSLINEALKKAQRLRADGHAGETAPPMPGSARVAKRGQARSSQTVVLIATGAAVLVVLSVVGTFWWINRPSPPEPRPVTTAPKSSPATPPVTAVAPSIPAAQKEEKLATTGPSLPAATPATAPASASSSRAGEPPLAAGATTPPEPKVSASPANSGVVAAAPPAPSVVVPAPQTPASAEPAPAKTAAPTTAPTAAPAATSPATTPAPTAPAVPPAPPKPDERIAAYVDALRVTAIRASANDSKVFMNDRVYRVNDIVDRSMGLRLIKVAPDSLTFADPNGVTYVKFF